jgi:hypothetical protein
VPWAHRANGGQACPARLDGPDGTVDAWINAPIPRQPNGHGPDMEQERPPLWFGKKEGGLRIAPLTWQGRAATFLYIFLVVVAVFTYSQLALTAFVVIFYTVAFCLLVVYKSDLMENWPPGS